MTPLYRALCETALSEYGVLEPSVSARGVFCDELGDLLQADDGPALILQALAFADTATGATIGREVVKARWRSKRASICWNRDTRIIAAVVMGSPMMRLKMRCIVRPTPSPFNGASRRNPQHEQEDRAKVPVLCASPRGRS